MGARFIEIDLKPGYKRGGMGKKHKHVKVMSPGTMKLKLTDDKRWELLRPCHPVSARRYGRSELGHRLADT